MPLAKIHVIEGRYDEARIAKVSGAIQAAPMNALHVPAEDFYQLVFDFQRTTFSTRRHSSACITPTT